MIKIAATLLVRDEKDIIKEWLDFHLPKIDFLIVTDNGSVDGTRDILEAYKENFLEKIVIIDEPEQNFMQHIWIDRMVNICKENNCDWVVNCDADEMFHCNFRELVSSVKDNVNSICIRCRLYIPTINDDISIKNPIERMKYLGGKQRLGKHISPFLHEVWENNEKLVGYMNPFVVLWEY